jgi:type I restriction enzyme S subunit
LPQNSADEPATELIKPIKDGVKPIDDGELLFDIPENWLWIRLGDLGFTQTGSTPPTSNPEFYGNEYPFVRPADISDGFDLTIAYRHDDGLSKSGIENGRLIKPDSIMMVCIGSVGKVGFVDRECACNQQINVLTPSIKLNAKLLTAFMRSPYFQKEAVTRASKTTLPILNKSKWAAIPIPIPPFAEQQRIIARVEELFVQTRALAKELEHSQIELDGLNKSALSHLLASETPEDFNQHWDFIAKHFDLLFQAPEHVAPLRQSILELAVRGKLTRREAGDESAGELLKKISEEKAKHKKKETIAPIKDDEKPFDLPVAWEWARLKQITIDLQTGPFGSNLHKSDYVSNGIPVVNPVNMRDGKIVSLSEMMISEKTRERLNQYILEEGDLVLARRGEIGRCALVTEKESGWLCGTGSLRMKLSKNISQGFIVLLLKTDFARSRLTKETVGITMSNMSQAGLENLTFALPPLAEQERIVERVEQLLSLCDALEARLQSAEEERGRLVSAVMAKVGTAVES